MQQKQKCDPFKGMLGMLQLLPLSCTLTTRLAGASCIPACCSSTSLTRARLASAAAASCCSACSCRAVRPSAARSSSSSQAEGEGSAAATAASQVRGGVLGRPSHLQTHQHKGFLCGAADTFAGRRLQQICTIYCYSSLHANMTRLCEIPHQAG